MAEPELRSKGRVARALESDRVVALLTALVTSAGILLARDTGLLEPVELLVYDRLLRLRPEPADPGPRVVIVGYSERDIQQQGTYPLPDATLAEVLEKLLSFEPRGIGVDFYRDVLIPPGSDRLESLLRSDSRVVMIHLVEHDQNPGIPPPAALIGTDQTGFADVPLDRDDSIRRALLYLEDEEGAALFSLALQVALRYLSAEGVGLEADPEDEEQIRLGEAPLRRFRRNDGGYSNADDAGYQMLIDFDGGRPFREVSMDEVLTGAAGAETFHDKMVFIGATAESIADLRLVPFGFWPGLFVHGHIASQLVRYGLGEDRPIAVLPDGVEAAWLALWSALGAGLALLRRSVWSFAAAMFLGSAGLIAGGLAALVAGWWIPVVPPVLGLLASAVGVTAYVSRRESVERKMLMQIFARHVSHRMADDVWAKRDQFLEGGRPKPLRQVVTVLFVDVKSFTPIAEGLEALSLMSWVNDLMGVLAQEVEQHGGFVDDYFGDGVKADFGVPVPRESEEEQDADAVTAVRCAIAMQARLAEQNARWREQGMPTGRLRVGIDSGLAVAGSLGSTDRLKYTVLGDIANTAARIEGLDDSAHDFDQRPVRILVSQRARIRLGDLFDVVDRGEFELKGKAKPMRVFEVLSR